MRRTLGIVGGGPRSLGLLERLLAHLDRRPPAALPVQRIEVLSDDGGIGAGWVYATGQPDVLRLNVAAGAVTVWPEGDGRSFDAWRAARGDDLREQFPPRATVGVYLREQADLVLTRLRAHLEVHVRRAHGVRVLGAPEAWEVDGDDGQRYGPWTDLVLATGHEQDWTGALRHSWQGPIPLHDSVFPIQRLVERPELHPGARVTIRGAGLTAIDAVLALSEQRRGARFTLVSRTGRPMHPKTALDVESLATSPCITSAIRALAADGRVHAVVRQTAIEIAADAPRFAGPPGLLAATDPRAEVARAVDRMQSGSPQTSAAAHDELAAAVAVARGERPVTGEWALAQAWRGLYPALVRLQEEVPPDGDLLGDPIVATWAREFERWAFGPPLATAERLLRLLDRDELTFRAGALIQEQDRPDLVLDAVLPPPGVRSATRTSLTGRLVHDGVVTPTANGRGAVTRPDGGVPGAPGLWLVGRATEDVVLGNDTLVRTLHPTLDRVADALLAELPAAAR